MISNKKTGGAHTTSELFCWGRFSTKNSSDFVQHVDIHLRKVMKLALWNRLKQYRPQRKVATADLREYYRMEVGWRDTMSFRYGRVWDGLDIDACID